MAPDHEVSGGDQFHFHPETYLQAIRADVPRYDELQEQTIAAIPFEPKRVLELGFGTADPVACVLNEGSVTGNPNVVFQWRLPFAFTRIWRLQLR